MAKCGINAQLLNDKNSYRKAGIHVYLLETLRHLPQDHSIEYSVFSNFHPAAKTTASINWVKTRPFARHPIGRIVWEQLVWPIRNRLFQFELIHGTAFSLPFFNRKPSIVTIFDLSFKYFPELFPRFRRLYLNTITRMACQRANKVITISEASKQDIVRFYRIDPAKITVVYPGIGERFKRQTDEDIERFRKEQNLPKSFILHVGTLQPRKNLPLLIDAFSKADLQETALVFAGGKGWFYDEIYKKVEELGVKDRVHFMGYVPDENLPLLYSSADCLIFPSVYEGFGMPILEAMGCGTPVISSNASAMPEAVGNAGILFDPRDVNDLVEAIRTLFNDKHQLNRLSELGLIQAQKFSWQIAGRQTAEVYKSILIDLQE